MLLLAWNACSHHSNGNWSHYRQSWPQEVRSEPRTFVSRRGDAGHGAGGLGAARSQLAGIYPRTRQLLAALEDFYQSPR